MQSCEHSHWCISPFRFFGQFLPKYQFGSFPCPQCAIARQLQWWRSQLQKLGIEWRSKVQTGPEILTANKRKSYFFIFLMLPFYCKAMVPGHIQIGGSFKVLFKYPSWLFFKFYCCLSLLSHGPSGGIVGENRSTRSKTTVSSKRVSPLGSNGTPLLGSHSAIL